MARLSVVAALSLMLFTSACSSRSKEMKNAETYMQVNELGKAKELLDLEIQTNPKNAEAYVMLAKVFLLGGDPISARAAFDKALLLDTGMKSEISKTYFEAAQGLAEKKGNEAPGPIISAYLEQAATLDPDLKGKIVDWAIKRAKAESTADKTVSPIALLQSAAKAAPDSKDRIADALIDTAKVYVDKQFLREAAAYAMEAGQQSASKLNAASGILRSACTLLSAQDREFARGCLEKAIQWNPALANDDDVFWLTHVGLAADGGSGVSDYLTKFANGKHVAEAKSIQAEREKVPGTILVVSATYGPACGAPTGNDTGNLVNQCNGRLQCSYRVSNSRPGGDPAQGCSKDYAAQYRCSNDQTKLRQVSHAVDKNEGYIVLLDCTSR